MPTDIPAPREERRSGSRPYMLCVASDPEVRARLARAANPADVVIMVPDTHAALEVLSHSAEVEVHEEWDGHVGSATDSAVAAASEIVFGDLTIDQQRAAVTWRGRRVPLTQLETAVLTCLVEVPGRVWTYQELYTAAWGGEYLGDRSSLHSLIKRLRRKLRDAGVRVDLRSVRGVGFQIRVSGDLGTLRPV